LVGLKKTGNDTETQYHELVGETADKYAVEVRNRFEALQTVTEDQTPEVLWKETMFC